MMNKNQKTILQSFWIRFMVIISLILIGITLQSFSENSFKFDYSMVLEYQPDPLNEDDDQIITRVEYEPEYPGGLVALKKFLENNLTYPEIARKDSLQGTVFVGFVVGIDGRLSDIKVLRGLSPELDAESIRIIEAMPDWKPGRIREKAVRVQFYLPIRFVLN
jgi:TonB family protein